MTDRKTTVDRRDVLKAASVGGAALGLASGSAAMAKSIASAAHGGPQRDMSFDADWKFFLGDPEDAQASGFADARWRSVDLPHDWQIEDLPGSSDDGGATANPSLYAFHTSPSPDGVAPPVIGPFDLNGDPKPDMDMTIPVLRRVGRNARHPRRAALRRGLSQCRCLAQRRPSGLPSQWLHHVCL